MTLISVIVGTFGSSYWKVLAGRARDSAMEQTSKAEVITVHGPSLHEARNEGADQATGDYLVFLDADDELDPGYVEAMERAIDSSIFRSDYRTFLYQPATLFESVTEPSLIPQRELDTGNFMVIGTAVSKRMFECVGGFLDWPIYEDWCLWIRCVQAGAGIAQVPEAIYKVAESASSRNKNTRLQAKCFHGIRSKYFD